MYTTEQFEKDVQGLRDLIKMCDELEKENDRKTNALIDQINGENAFSLEGKLMNKFYIVEEP